MNTTHHITQLLHEWNKGDAEALNRLIPLADRELKKIARKRLRKQPGTPFQPTELVHEAWLKLFREKKEPVWTNRGQFYSLLARRMRQILWNYGTRNPNVEYTGLTGKMLPQKESTNIVLLHQALEKFTNVRPRAARVVELRYFGGYTIPAVAKILKIGAKTVELDTEFARGWLWREISNSELLH